jgi:GntR family transcriptional repressor for pyruvate dehydrogenase complex
LFRGPDGVDKTMCLEVLRCLHPRWELGPVAAERRTDAEMAAIDDALAIMTVEITEGDRGVSGDEQFHHAVTVAAHSPLLARLMEEIAELIRETRIESLSHLTDRARPSRGTGESRRRCADRIRSTRAAPWPNTYDSSPM